MTVELHLASEFTNRWSHAESAGYIYSGGFGRVRVLDELGYPVTQRQLGPAFEELCGPRTGTLGNPLVCYTAYQTEVTTFEPTGFSIPRLVGGIDLTGR